MASGGSTRAKKPTILSAEAILERNDLPERTIEVPDWGGAVKIRALSKRQLDDVTKASQVQGETDDLKFEMNLLVEGIVEPKFTKEQIGQLQEKSVGAVDLLIAEIMDISKLTTKAVAAIAAAFRDES